jgi:hypothetical protein
MIFLECDSQEKWSRIYRHIKLIWRRGMEFAVIAFGVLWIPAFAGMTAEVPRVERLDSSFPRKRESIASWLYL